MTAVGLPGTLMVLPKGITLKNCWIPLTLWGPLSMLPPPRNFSSCQHGPNLSHLQHPAVLKDSAPSQMLKLPSCIVNYMCSVWLCPFLLWLLPVTVTDWLVTALVTWLVNSALSQGGFQGCPIPVNALLPSLSFHLASCTACPSRRHTLWELGSCDLGSI